jgi:hypothetical protein
VQPFNNSVPRWHRPDACPCVILDNTCTYLFPCIPDGKAGEGDHGDAEGGEGGVGVEARVVPKEVHT